MDAWKIVGICATALLAIVTTVTSIFTLLNSFAIRRLQEYIAIPGSPSLLPIEHSQRSVKIKNQGARAALLQKVATFKEGWLSRWRPYRQRTLRNQLIDPDQTVDVTFDIPDGDFVGEVRIYFTEADGSRVAGRQNPYWVKFYR